jgi:hypothetical protein
MCEALGSSKDCNTTIKSSGKENPYKQNIMICIPEFVAVSFTIA